jgi:hypothetical protein
MQTRNRSARGYRQAGHDVAVVIIIEPERFIPWHVTIAATARQ